MTTEVIGITNTKITISSHDHQLFDVVVDAISTERPMNIVEALKLMSFIGSWYKDPELVTRNLFVENGEFKFTYEYPPKYRRN